MTFERTTLSDQVAQAIIKEIDERRLRPGDEIPAEGELGERYGVNRLVVREAVRTLVAREILVSSQGKRARVSTPSPAVFAQILGFRLSQQSMELADLLYTRRVIECELAAQAAVQIAAGQGDIGPLERALAGMRDAGGERETFISHDIAFHQAIADLANAPILAFVLAGMHDVLLYSRRASFEGRAQRVVGIEATIGEHQLILAAITAGDSALASRTMADHLAETGHDLGLRMPDSSPLTSTASVG